MSRTLNAHAELLEEIRQSEVRLAELQEKANNYVPASISVVPKEMPLGCAMCTRVQCPLECEYLEFKQVNALTEEHLIGTTPPSEPSDQWTDVIQKLFHLTRDYEKIPAIALSLKLSEEVGEFSEIMLYELGHLPHKADKLWKDTPVEEAADIMNVLIGTLSVHYPDIEPDELAKNLLTAMEKKGKKYARVLNADHVFA